MKPCWQLGLTGWPLGHSLSPVMHKAALQYAGMDGTYSLFPVSPEPENNSGLVDLLARVRRNEINGLNVTIPHKQTVIPLLDSLTPAAGAIGAVNTISLVEGQLTGDNTDWTGFSLDLSIHLPESMLMDESRRALVLGAGGSARAVVYALSRAGWYVSIHSRRLEQAAALTHDFSAPAQPVKVVSAEEIADMGGISLIVNTTPAGMSPNIAETPWPTGLAFPSGAYLYDLIYNPSETALMKAARIAGLTANNGLGMLASQAACAFEIWTGTSVPSEVFIEAALERNLT